jgi:hypothetical protein
MAHVEGRTALYAKAHRKVTVAQVLASAALLIDTVKLGAKVNSVPAPAVTSLQTAHAVAQLNTRVLAVPLETAARSTEVVALPLNIARLDARVSSELALGTAKCLLMARAVVLTAIRVLIVPLETAVRNTVVAGLPLTIVLLDARARLAHALGVAKSHLTQAVEARTVIRVKEVLSEIAVLLPDIVAARRRFVRLVARLLLVHARPAATRSQRTVIAEAPKDKLVREVRSETAVPASVAAAVRLDTAPLGVRAHLESVRRRVPTQAAFPRTVHAEGPKNTVSLL